MQDYAATSASSLVGRAREGVGEMVAGVSTRGQEAVGEAVAGVREVGDNLTHAIDESLKRRPYTTLAFAFGMGFVFAMLSR